MAANPIALLLIAQDAEPAGRAELHRLAALLSAQLAVDVHPCFLAAEPTLDQSIEVCANAGVRTIVVLPLLLGAAETQKNAMPTAINLARRRWPDITFCYGTPLNAQYALVRTLAERADQARAAAASAIPWSETALAIIGQGRSDPDSNAEVARLARLLWEGREYGWVEYGFYGWSRPDPATTIARCIALGARQVLVLPYVLFSGRVERRIGMFVEAAQRRHSAVPIRLAKHLGVHAGVLAALKQRYTEALSGAAAMNCDVCAYRQLMPGFEQEYDRPQATVHSPGERGFVPTRPHGHSHGLVHSILPPRYQGNVSVSAAPMAGAVFVYDAEGRVAWDQLWGQDDAGTPFCELALAGGPPHRGVLLEPVTVEAVAAQPEAYQRVVAELARGLAMVTGLPIHTDGAPGWVGVHCTSEEMALWMLRAIVVENISVRREGAVLFVPAGPAFQLEAEIRNVITAVAKTHHYWQEHLQATVRQ